MFAYQVYALKVAGSTVQLDGVQYLAEVADGKGSLTFALVKAADADLPPLTGCWTEEASVEAAIEGWFRANPIIEGAQGFLAEGDLAWRREAQFSAAV